VVQPKHFQLNQNLSRCVFCIGTQISNIVRIAFKKMTELLNSISVFFFFLHISTCEKLLQFKSDNSAIGFGSGTAALEQAIEKTKANIKWVSENQREITDWLVAESA